MRRRAGFIFLASLGWIACTQRSGFVEPMADGDLDTDPGADSAAAGDRASDSSGGADPGDEGDSVAGGDAGGDDGPGGDPNPPLPDAGTWTWVAGTSATADGGAGTPCGASASAPQRTQTSGVAYPGSRQAASYGMVGGVIWLLGGDGCGTSSTTGFLMDGWTWSGSTWILQGGATQAFAAEQAGWPSVREGGALWEGADGLLYLFGGRSYESPSFWFANDVWRREAGGTWTKLLGDDLAGTFLPSYAVADAFDAANMPGARVLMARWAPGDGTLWVYGGNGVNTSGSSGYLRDLWQYDPALNQWAWRFGDSGINSAPTASTPGGRFGSMTWTTGDGQLWLFGGGETAGTHAVWADLWYYDIGLDTFVRVRDPGAPNTVGVYGVATVADPLNTPGARSGGATFVDSAGRFWLFGGYGFGATSVNPGSLNDLWYYDRSTDRWTYVGGASEIDDPGDHGQLGVAAPSNQPPARLNPSLWPDGADGFWLFGGGLLAAPEQLTQAGQSLRHTDLWHWTP